MKYYRIDTISGIPGPVSLDINDTVSGFITSAATEDVAQPSDVNRRVSRRNRRKRARSQITRDVYQVVDQASPLSSYTANLR